MNTYFYIAAALVIALAALAIYLWRLYRVENQRKWDEISVALTNEKEAIRAADSEKIVQEGIWRAEHELRLKAELKCMALQDKVSALYCPTSNHVWKDGICVKCGKEQDNGMD